ncbi:hypothetical protein ACSMXN_12815 [Jatrophihabitans sp. DSM 45814]
MSYRRCAQLAAWGSAWLRGSVAFDAVLDAVGSDVRNVAGPGFAVADLHPVGTALTDWKRSGARTLTLALPVPGDVRGMAGEPSFRDVALRSGQAVFGADTGVTCELGPKTPSSAARELRWHRSVISGRVPDYIGLTDAEHDLTEAIRETASEFARRGTESWMSDIASALSDARRAGERLHLPSSHPARAVRVIAQAERLAAVLEVVDADTSGEVNAAGMRERASALRPLRVAVRRALIAGYNADVDVAAS